MAFQPISEEKFSELTAQGFTPEQIISFEQRRKTEETAQSSTGEGGLRGFSKGFAKQTLSSLQNIGNVIAKPVGKLFGVDEDKIGIPEEVLELKGGAEKVGGFTSEVAQFAIPATKLAKLGKVAGAGYKTIRAAQIASSGVMGYAQEGEVKGAATAATIEAVAPVLFKVLGKAVSKVAGKSSRALEAINLRLTPTQKQQLIRAEPGIIDYMTKNKITGTPQVRYEKMGAKIDVFEKKIQQLLKGKTYSKDQAINAIKDLPEEFLEKAQNPQVYDNMVKETNKLIDLITKRKGNTIDATTINQWKRSYAKNARNKAGDAVLNDARESISDGLYLMLQKSFDSLKPINADYSQALTAYKLIGKSIGRNELGLIGSLVSSGVGGAIGSGAGGYVGSGIGIAAGPQIGKRVAGTQARSVIGAGLENLSQYLGKAKVTSAGDYVIPKSIIQSLLNQ